MNRTLAFILVIVAFVVGMVVATNCTGNTVVKTETVIETKHDTITVTQQADTVYRTNVVALPADTLRITDTVEVIKLYNSVQSFKIDYADSNITLSTTFDLVQNQIRNTLVDYTFTKTTTTITTDNYIQPKSFIALDGFLSTNAYGLGFSYNNSKQHRYGLGYDFNNKALMVSGSIPIFKFK